MKTLTILYTLLFSMGLYASGPDLDPEVPTLEKPDIEAPYNLTWEEYGDIKKGQCRESRRQIRKRLELCKEAANYNGGILTTVLEQMDNEVTQPILDDNEIAMFCSDIQGVKLRKLNNAEFAEKMTQYHPQVVTLPITIAADGESSEIPLAEYSGLVLMLKAWMYCGLTYSKAL